PRRTSSALAVLGGGRDGAAQLVLRNVRAAGIAAQGIAISVQCETGQSNWRVLLARQISARAGHVRLFLSAQHGPICSARDLGAVDAVSVSLVQVPDRNVPGGRRPRRRR